MKQTKSALYWPLRHRKGLSYCQRRVTYLSSGLEQLDDEVIFIRYERHNYAAEKHASRVYESTREPKH